ncbi:hypothetical protein [Helicobacter pylori]|uniref:hypothetical protein n=1 Tax=Helicobacter pylori TaxID=210 RepID=UPI0015E7415A|nr:hypothetical protein [Helicobacter pylori]WQX18624.1 hypothetical protein E5P79_00540 [Helicobacter pylori]
MSEVSKNTILTSFADIESVSVKKMTKINFFIEILLNQEIHNINFNINTDTMVFDWYLTPKMGKGVGE